MTTAPMIFESACCRSGWSLPASRFLAGRFWSWLTKPLTIRWHVYAPVGHCEGRKGWENLDHKRNSVLPELVNHTEGCCAAMQRSPLQHSDTGDHQAFPETIGLPASSSASLGTCTEFREKRADCISTLSRWQGRGTGLARLTEADRSW
jgi:hypothetical protein